MIGQTISHYKILEHLGGGGMGVVYKAQDLKLDRSVALKFLPPELTRDPEAKLRFIHEAKAASALDHPNICVVHEIGEIVDDQIFICMAYYEGETLKKKIERGPLPLHDAIDIALQVARGLQAAHEAGMVHRDVKPANIMVTAKGEAKILDFGVAKLAGQAVLTKTGSTVGTAAYASPEQTRGEEVDRRSDIFSLGVVLYEMITVHRPFRGEHEAAVMYSITNETPEPLARYKADVPDELQRVIDKSLAKEKGDRYQHIDEVLVDLRSCSTSTSRLGAQAQRPAVLIRTKRRLFWYGAAAGLAALTLVAYFLVPREEEPTSRLKMIAVLPFENLGPAEDDYFADGLTDEITSRLSLIGTLGVISRTSSMQYKKTSKTLPVVAKELGVDYILEGTIRWVKTGGSQRIRITPQLIKVSGDVHLWADNIDRTLDDIFAVQTEIATRVVTSLDIVLGEGEKSAIGAIPTKNLEAYQAYLRGLSFGQRYERLSVETAIEMFDRAVRLDSSFALAYAQLSSAHLNFYWEGYGHTNERLAAAKKCLDKAFALQRELPEAYLALGWYYYRGYRDYDRALEALAVAEKKLPNNSEVLDCIAAIWRRQGKFEEAAELWKKAFELNPQASDVPLEIGNTLLALGMYTDAEAYYDRSISLLPDQASAYGAKAWMYVRWNGDTRKSRSELERIPWQYHPWFWLAGLDTYERNYQAALDRLEDAADRTHEDQTSIIPVSLLRGLLYRFMNDSVHSCVAFDSARVFLEAEIKKRPDDYRLHSSLGIVYAGLGSTEKAIREAQLAVAQLPLTLDHMDGTLPLLQLAQVYTMVGEYDAALDKLEYLLSLRAPKWTTTPILRLEPIYDPLRSNPRFQALVAKAELLP